MADGYKNSFKATEAKWVLSLGDTTTCGLDGGETIAKFISESQVYQKPGIISATDGGNFSAIAIDSLLTTICDQDVHCINLKSKIDDISLLNGGYIAIGERKGTLTVGVLGGDNQLEVKLSCLLIPEVNDHREYAFVRVLFQITEEFETGSRAQIICLSYQGLLMTFSDIMLENGDIDLSCVKQGKIATAHDRAYDFVALRNHIITVGTGSHCLAVHGVTNGQLFLEDAASLDDENTDMVKIHVSAIETVFVTLDSKGKFYVWDMQTLVVVHTWVVTNVTDFKLVQFRLTQDFSFSLCDLKLVVVQPKRVQTLSLPSLTVGLEYCLSADFAVLTKCPAAQDEIYVAECRAVEEDDDSETSVYFRCYAETNPQKRLQRLIAKRRYEEAEKLAKLFGLPFNLGPEIVQSKMRQARGTYAEMAEHIMQCREQLLKNKSGEESVAMVMEQLQELEFRLDSYKHVFGEENYNSLEWEEFQYENPLTLCNRLLMKDAEKAFKLWACFQESLQKLLKPGLVHKVLQRIPVNVPGHMVTNWLCQSVIPFIVEADPGAVETIILWVEEQVQSLEMSGKGNWLDDALQVSTTVLASLEQAVMCDVDDITDSNIQAVKTKMKCGIVLSSLRTLVKLLQELKELKTKYKCHLTLDVFRKETKESIAFRMLDGVVDVQLLPETLSKQVLPYLKHNAIEPNEVFAKYIQDLLERSSASCPQQMLEDKIKAVIKVIRDPKEKVNAVLNLLGNVMLPLPEFIAVLVSEVIATVQHSLVATLKEKWNIKEADSIIYSFGLNPREVNSAHKARNVARCIIAEGGSVSDAQKILFTHKISVEDEELPVFQCRIFIERNQVDKLAQHLKLLPVKTAIKCCNFIISTAVSMMADEQNLVEQRMMSVRFLYYEAAMISVSVLKTFIDEWLEKMKLDETAERIKNVWNLEKYYKMYVNDADLSDKLKCKIVFSKFIQSLDSTAMCRLARMLNLRDGEMIEAVISQHIQNSENQVLAKILQKLAKLYGTCDSLPEAVVHDVLHLIHTKDVISFSQCLKLAQLYLTHCSEEQIQIPLEVCRQASFVNAVSVQNQKSISIQANGLLNFGHFQDFSSSSLEPERVLCMQEAVLELSFDDELVEKKWVVLKALVGNLLQGERHQMAVGILLSFANQLYSMAAFLPANQKQGYTAVLKNTTELARNIISDHIQKILNTVPLDAHLALAHILTLPKEESVTLVHRVIESCWSSYSKLKKMNTVVCAAAEILGNQTLIDSSREASIGAKWGNRFPKIGIPFKRSYLKSVGEAMEAVRKLAQNPHCNVKIVVEFFRDFSLDICQLDKVLTQLFEACLTTHSETGLSPAMQRKAEDALQCFGGDPISKMKMLKKVLQETHPYNYEVLQFLLEKIQEQGESKETVKGLELLRYLNHYTRCSPPCGAEMRLIGHDDDDDDDDGENESRQLRHSLLPDAASVRLPFHLLMGKDNIWEVISAEINPQNLSLWLDMAPVLSIQRDSLLIKASTNITEGYIKSSSTSSNGEVSPEFCRIMKEVDNILSHLNEKELAVMWCYSMLKKLTSAGEKTAALQGCIKHAQKWLDSAAESQEMEKAKKSLQIFYRELKFHSTFCVLCRAGLDKEKELVRLLKQPEELIQHMYSLPCVIDHNKEQIDINRLSDEVAKVHGVSLLDIRRALLDKWLLETSIADPDQTLTFDIFLENNKMNKGDNLKRALYVMKSVDRRDLLQHVASYASLKVGSVSPGTHKKALFIVLKVGTEEEIAHLLNIAN